MNAMSKPLLPQETVLPFAVSPQMLLRLNLTATTSLGNTHADVDAQLIAEMTELSAQQEAATEKLTDFLYGVAGRVDRPLRQKLILPLRRAIHNGRLPRQMDYSDIKEYAHDSELETWFERQLRLEVIRGHLLEGHTVRLDEERAALRELLGCDYLRRSLAVSSELLPAAADKYRAGPWENVSKSTRKSEESLLRYAMRACTKSSPYSLYTAAGMVATEPATSEGLTVTSAMEPNRSLLRRIESNLVRYPLIRAGIHFHPSPGLRSEDGNFIATGDRERLGAEAAEVASRFGEAKVTIPANAASVALLKWLRTQERSRATFAELAGVIEAKVPGADSAKAAAFVSGLCGYGILVAEPIIDDMTPDALRALNSWLATFDHDPTIAAIRSELASLCEAQDAFPEADPHERVKLLRSGRAHRDEVLRLLNDPVSERPAPEPIWYEDGVIETASFTSTADWKPVLDDCQHLLDILHIFDEQHVFMRVLRHRFISRFGVGGNTDDLDALGDVFVPAYDDALQITEGFDNELIHSDPVLSQLIPLRNEIVSDMAQRLLRSGPVDDPEAPEELDPGWLQSIVERIPAWIADSPASYGIFLQPLGGNPPNGAILNKIYNGWGNYISRFLNHASSEVVDASRSHLRQFFPPTDTVAELRPVQGFNANIHPLLAEVDLDWDDSGDPAMLPLNRLQARHDAEADRIVLWDPQTKRRIHPLYLGFLVPYYLPSRLVPLTAMGGSGSVFFEPQVSADRTPAVDRSGVRHYRGLKFKSIWIARPRWHVPSDIFPRQEPGETEPEYFLRLSEWRSSHGIPTDVFVHPPAPELEPGKVNDYFGEYMDNRKPQYVNLLSRLHVRHLARLLAYQPGVDIVVEEAKPGPEEHFPVAGHDHAAELVAEFYRKARNLCPCNELLSLWPITPRSNDNTCRPCCCPVFADSKKSPRSPTFTSPVTGDSVHTYKSSSPPRTTPRPSPLSKASTIASWSKANLTTPPTSSTSTPTSLCPISWVPLNSFPRHTGQCGPTTACSYSLNR